MNNLRINLEYDRAECKGKWIIDKRNPLARMADALMVDHPSHAWTDVYRGDKLIRTATLLVLSRS